MVILQNLQQSGIIGQSVSNLKSDLSLNLVENISLSNWNGSTNIATVGTITTGTFNATAISDDYISSASTWMINKCVSFTNRWFNK